MISLSKKAEGMFTGAAIGDALGLPVEIKTRFEILAALHPSQLIESYLPVSINGLYAQEFGSDARFPDKMHRLGITPESTGICSDDTLLTLSLARSLDPRSPINPEHIFNDHITTWKEDPVGFGKMTSITFSDMDRGQSWTETRVMSFGNGFMMKQSPLALYEVLRGMSVSDSVARLVNITHAFPVAQVAAQIHHRLLVDLLLSTDRTFDMRAWLVDHIEEAQSWEDSYEAFPNVSAMMERISQYKAGENISLSDIYLDNTRKVSDEKRPAFNILSTIGIVYAIFLQEQSFRSVQMAASIGGDTDSYASIIGAMVGATQGKFYNDTWKEGIHERYRKPLDVEVQRWRRYAESKI